VYPGTFSSETLQKRQAIRFCHFESYYNSDNAYSFSFLTPTYNGVLLGVDYVNENAGLFPDFVLERVQFDYGVSTLDKEQVDGVFDPALFETACIAPPFSGFTVELANYFRERSVAVPFIGYSNTITDLSSQIDFPSYVRVVPPDSYQAVVLRMLIQRFGWTKIAVLYMGDSFSKSLYNDFKQQAAEHRITILNPDDNQLPADSEQWEPTTIDV
jgi:hypothetical protein